MNRALSIIAFLFLVLSSIAARPQFLAVGREGIVEAASAVLPLGIQVLAPGEHGAAFAVYASMEGMSAPTSAAEGNPPRTHNPVAEKHFPSLLSFRVTATTIGINTIETPVAIETNIDTAELIKSLQFRLRINDGGLQTERIQPVEIRLIGVPADVPYGERIYRVIFQMPRLSPNARFVLEIVAPTGELLSKFPLG